jgi:hypothetical protein
MFSSCGAVRSDGLSVIGGAPLGVWVGRARWVVRGLLHGFRLRHLGVGRAHDAQQNRPVRLGQALQPLLHVRGPQLDVPVRVLRD